MVVTLILKRALGRLGRALAPRSSAMKKPEEQGDGAAPPAARLTVGKVAQEGLVLYHNLNKLDRWGGGGFGLSTLVKLAGWAGLIALLGALVVKLRTVESQLDPVSHGVDQLRAELDHARVDLEREAGRGKAELTNLREDATGLRRSVQEASDAHARGSASLSDADRSARELSEGLRHDLERGKAVDAQQEQVAAGLGAYQQQLDSAKAGLTEQAGRSQASLAELGESLHQTQDHARALDHDLAGLSAQGVKDELARIDAEARALELALHSAAEQAHELDRVLAQRLEEERRRAKAEPPPAIALVPGEPGAAVPSSQLKP